MAALITNYSVSGREKSNGQSCPPSSGVPKPPPVYAEIKPGLVWRMEMKGVAYALLGPVDKMKMIECVTY